MDTDRPQRQLTTALVLFVVVVLLAGIWWLARAQRPVPAPGSGAQPTPASTATGRVAPDEAPLTRTMVAARGANAPADEVETTVLVRVVDHDGRPLAGVELRVARPGPWGTFKDLRTALTAPDGTASFAGYARDVIWAEVVADTLPPGHVAGGRVHGSLEAEPQATLTIECPAAATVRGRVVRAFGEPLGGAAVDLVPVDHDSRPVLLHADRDGTFRLERAHPGSWRVQLRVDDRRRLIGIVLPVPVTIRVPPGGDVPVVLACRRDGAWIHGRAVDQHDRPVAGVLVLAGTPATSDEQTAPAVAGMGRAFAETDALGHYRLGPLPTEPLAVQVGHRHGSHGVTRDRALFTAWPAPFLATPGDGIEHVTSVTVIEHAVSWRLRPVLDPAFGQRTGIGAEQVRCSVGWCRLFEPVDGAWQLRSERRGEPRLFVITAGEHEWRIHLPEPEGDLADVEVRLPPRGR